MTYYYTQYKPIAGSSEYEGSEAMPKIDENTAISEPGTYYVDAKSGETKNYEEERSTTVELTVNEAVVEAASITKADGTDGGTYESLSLIHILQPVSPITPMTVCASTSVPFPLER